MTLNHVGPTLLQDCTSSGIFGLNGDWVEPTEVEDVDLYVGVP